MVDEERAVATFDGVVPFRLPKQGALDRLSTYLDSRLWAPTKLRKLRVHGRGLRGVLIPFWVHDARLRSEYEAKIGIHWYRRESYTNREGERDTRTVRETEWHALRGSAAHEVRDHPVSASVGLPEDEALSLGLYDYGWITAYDPRVLSGFEAELPTVERAAAARVAVAEMRDAEAARILRELLPGDSKRLDRITTKVELRARRLILLPVWVATFHHGEHVLRLLVNGQTGEVSGRVPVSRIKVAVATLAVAVILTIIYLLTRTGGGIA